VLARGRRQAGEADPFCQRSRVGFQRFRQQDMEPIRADPCNAIRLSCLEADGLADPARTPVGILVGRQAHDRYHHARRATVAQGAGVLLAQCLIPVSAGVHRDRRPHPDDTGRTCGPGPGAGRSLGALEERFDPFADALVMVIRGQDEPISATGSSRPVGRRDASDGSGTRGV